MQDEKKTIKLQNIEEAKATLQRYPFPVDIIVEVTGICNLRCIMCPQSTMKRAKGEMQFCVFKKIADEVATEGPDSRMWMAIMGEPLLIGDRLIQMIEYAKSRGIKTVNLNTNAVYLSQSMADKLIHAGVDEVIVGLDAFAKATYEAIRVNGKFEDTVANVEYLLNSTRQRPSGKPKVVLQFIVMDENESEVEAFKDYWLSRGAVVKIRPKLGWGTGVKADNLNLPDSERTFPCPWLVRTVSIHWTGKVAQCDGDYEGNHSPGDVMTQSIKEIWTGELARRRERHWAGDFSHPLCSECKDWQAGRSAFFYPDVRPADAGQSIGSF